MSDSQVLLDTQILLWYWMGDGRLPEKVVKILDDGDRELFFSMASVWEIFIKCRTGKLSLGPDPEKTLRQLLDKSGVRLLPIRYGHTAGILNLPDHHKDPFDRIIIAQALHENLPVISADEVFLRYGVRNLF